MWVYPYSTDKVISDMNYNINNNIQLFKNGSSEVKLSSFRFPAGEIQVRIMDDLTWMNQNGQIFCNFRLVANIRSSDDLIATMLLLDAVDVAMRQGTDGRRWKVDLEIPYFPYGRQDRACSPGEASSAAVICSILNGATNIERLITWDVHSHKSVSMIDGSSIRVCNLRPRYFLEPMIKNLKAEHGKLVQIICPDDGATERCRDVAALTDLPMIRMKKKRDPVTGNLSGFSFAFKEDQDNIVNDAILLVVDDICDGGWTFCGIGDEIRTVVGGNPDLCLYVTHGIFSKGYDELLKRYDEIWYANVAGPTALLPPSDKVRQLFV